MVDKLRSHRPGAPLPGVSNPRPNTHYASQVVAERLLDLVDKRSAEPAMQMLAKQHQPTATKGLLRELAKLTRWQPQHKTFYLSTPITGGTRLYGFLENKGKKSKQELTPAELEGYQSKVIQANCRHADYVGDKLQREGKQVIAPSNIGLPGWSQTDYNKNWTKMVESAHLDGLMVCDGWQLSYGCLLEVRTALDHHIPVMDEQHNLIDLKKACDIVKKASDELHTRGFQIADLTRVLTDPVKSLAMEG